MISLFWKRSGSSRRSITRPASWGAPTSRPPVITAKAAGGGMQMRKLLLGDRKPLSCKEVLDVTIAQGAGAEIVRSTALERIRNTPVKRRRVRRGGRPSQEG